jgi:L-asparagine transporter-like permease
MVVIVMVVAVVVVLCGGSERDAAEDLGEVRLADDGEFFLGGFGGVGVG